MAFSLKNCAQFNMDSSREKPYHTVYFTDIFTG